MIKSEQISEAGMNIAHSDRDQAKDFFENGLWEEAFSRAKAVLGYNPFDQEMRLLVADSLLHLGQVEESVQQYRDLLKDKPELYIAHHKLARSLTQLGSIHEADEQYSYLLEKQPDFVQQNMYDFSVQQQSGDFFFRKNNWSRAVDAYRQAITVEPYACWEHINLGRSLAKLECYSEAITMLEKAVSLNPNSGWANYHLAEVLHENGDFEAAIEYARTSTILMPNHQESKNLLAKLNSKIRKLEQENRHLSKEHTQINSETNEYHSSSIDFDKDNIIPGWKESYELGKKLQIRGELEDAAKAYYQSIIKNPHYSWSYHELGDVNLKLGNWYEAIAAYQQAIRLNPDYFWSNYNLGQAYKRTGDWENTVKLNIQSAKLNPGLNLPIRTLEETLVEWYEALMKQGDDYLHSDPDKALATYREAIAVYRDNTFFPDFAVARERRDTLKVLLIVDAHLSQCLRYRVKQKLEQLEAAGFNATYYSWTNLDAAKNKVSYYDVLIFYRTPAFPNIIRLIKYAKAIKKVVFYEIDDLIFDPELFPEPIESYGGQVTQEQYDGLVRGTILFQEAMRLCDLAIASTPPLQAQIEKHIGNGKCFLHRNALDSKIYDSLKVANSKVSRDYISIFYGSGTKAHNSDFDELVAPALAKILSRYSNVRLTLMGYLTIPPILEPQIEQIDRIDLVDDIGVYYEFLKQADICIAVLHPTVVNNCKSELKWFEAASFKIPSVVSNTEVYVDVVNHGKDGFIASNPQEWFSCLEHLILDENLRKEIGKSAFDLVMQKYSIVEMSTNIKNIIYAGLDEGVRVGDLIPPVAKKKLLIVNVFYSPQSIGGATRIVKDNVDILLSHYGDEYEISIFTTDEGNSEPYQMLEYSWEGVFVTKVSSPMMEGMDWQYQNPKMYEIFKDYLEYHKPDLIHFHCVQRLTASVLEAAADLEIPYFVTAHDAWWISDHQFLVNESGEECNYKQNDPVVVAKDAKNLTDSLKRKLYLREQLNKAAAILAVSETFAEIYRLNGFTQTKTNRNGIQPKALKPKQPSPSGRIRIAHIGGMAAHKGYFLFKEAVEKANLSNIEVIVINHAQAPGTVEHGDWNGTPVTFLAKYKQDEINNLYSEVDVLMAPSMWPESFGLVTREAAAANVWVVTSDKGAIGEDVIHKENGHICSVEDSSDLIHVLQEIDANPAMVQIQAGKTANIRKTKEQVSELVQFYRTIVKQD